MLSFALRLRNLLEKPNILGLLVILMHGVSTVLGNLRGLEHVTWNGVLYSLLLQVALGLLAAILFAIGPIATKNYLQRLLYWLPQTIFGAALFVCCYWMLMQTIVLIFYLCHA